LVRAPRRARIALRLYCLQNMHSVSVTILQKVAVRLHVPVIGLPGLLVYGTMSMMHPDPAKCTDGRPRNSFSQCKFNSTFLISWYLGSFDLTIRYLDLCQLILLLSLQSEILTCAGIVTVRIATTSAVALLILLVSTALEPEEERQSTQPATDGQEAAEA